MLTKEQQETRTLIDQAIRPVQRRLDRAERELRRLKSDLSQTKNTVSRLKKNG